MDIKVAKEIVMALADGVNPLTGELLPDDSIYNNADVVRALYTLLNNIEHRNVKCTKFENAGMPWSVEDDELLIKMFKNGSTKKEMQEHFKRSPGSISSRLAKFGITECL